MDLRARRRSYAARVERGGPVTGGVPPGDPGAVRQPVNGWAWKKAHMTSLAEIEWVL
jgi:hypothetical protein